MFNQLIGPQGVPKHTRLVTNLVACDKLRFYKQLKQHSRPQFMDQNLVILQWKAEKPEKRALEWEDTMWRELQYWTMLHHSCLA